MKINKNIKIFFNYFLGPALFVWLCWSIYHQIKQQPDLPAAWVQIKQAFYTKKVILLLTVIGLMLFHWLIEAYKWRLAVRQVQPISFGRAFKAVLSGISFSVSTPNNIGEYVGRVLYIEEGKRIKVITLTIVSSASQLIITLLMGVVGLYFLRPPILDSKMISIVWFDVIFYICSAVFLILTFFYFNISWLVKWIDKLPASKKFSWSIEALEQFDATLLLRFLSLSLTRFFVFIVQYYLLFQVFGVSILFLQTVQGMSVVFLILAIIPTIAIFTDLSIRSSTCLMIMGLFSANQLGISLVAVAIWMINMIFPALIGSILVLGIKKIFRNKHETP